MFADHAPSGPPRPYAVRERSARLFLELPVAVGFGVGWFLFATRVVHASVMFGVLGLCVVGYGVFRTFRPVPSLRVGPGGVRLGGVEVPWGSIREIVIVLPAVQVSDSPSVEVGLRLHHGAPLPDGMDAIVHDPQNPDATHLSRVFGPGRIEPGALAAAASGRAAVIESRAGTERRIG